MGVLYTKKWEDVCTLESVFCFSDMVALRATCKGLRGGRTLHEFLRQLLKVGLREVVDANRMNPINARYTMSKLFVERALLGVLGENGATVAGSFALHKYMHREGLHPCWHPSDIDVYTSLDIETASRIVQSVLRVLPGTDHPKNVVDKEKEEYYKGLGGPQARQQYSMDDVEQAIVIGHNEVDMDVWMKLKQGLLAGKRGLLGEERAYKILDVAWTECCQPIRPWCTRKNFNYLVVNTVQIDRSLTAMQVTADFDFANVQVAVHATPYTAHLAFSLTDEARDAIAKMELVPTPRLFPRVCVPEDFTTAASFAATVVCDRIRKYERRGFYMRGSPREAN